MASLKSTSTAHRRINSSASESSYDSSGTSISSLSSNSLRIFLVQTAKGLFSSSGGYKANLCFLRYLASRGHYVRQVCYAYRGEIDAHFNASKINGVRDPQRRVRQLRLRVKDEKVEIVVKVDEFMLEDGVEIVALEKEAFDEAFGGKENILKILSKETADYIERGVLSARLLDFVSFLQQEVVAFTPTHVVFNDGLSMQATSALKKSGLNACRIAIIHTAEQLPFGPFYGGMPGHACSPSELNLLQELDGIWSVSKAIKQYALEHGNLTTEVFPHHPWTYLDEMKHEIPDHRHNWDKKLIGMINPCKVKGLQILVSLATACPQHDFLVYKSWGFDKKVQDQLEGLKNITIRSSCTDMEEAWNDIKVLLVPSLWHEAWGIVVIEAHLRGIPVIASDAGALPEAMLGLEHVIPVNPIRGESDETGEYIIPEQNIEPWVNTVSRLMRDRPEYERLSDKTRSVTWQWLKDIDETGLERWLSDMALRMHEIDEVR